MDLCSDLGIRAVDVVDIRNIYSDCKDKSDNSFLDKNIDRANQSLHKRIVQMIEVGWWI